MKTLLLIAALATQVFVMMCLINPPDLVPVQFALLSAACLLADSIARLPGRFVACLENNLRSPVGFDLPDAFPLRLVGSGDRFDVIGTQPLP